MLSCRVVVAVGSLQPGSGLQVTGRGLGSKLNGNYRDRHLEVWSMLQISMLLFVVRVWCGDFALGYSWTNYVSSWTCGCVTVRKYTTCVTLVVAVSFEVSY
mgnify:CR=1 FL=1